VEPSPTADSASQQRLFALLYEELRRLAQRELRGRGPSSTLSPTTLLHELYLNLQERAGVRFPDRARFLAYAARAMRGLIIDYARRRKTIKRGAAFEITSLTTDLPEYTAECAELERLADALERLESTEPRLALVVTLKYFCGFSFADIGPMMGISERTLKRDWRKARLFLRECLTEPDLDD
jgi:RNA polymerase sigma factor (TIGR02999 family)